jgi:4-diphosphocytidyl-2-C-methyl-D-erythritol kinase
MDEIDAPAKLTLSLAVGPPQSDGYHPIESEMVMLTLADRVLIAPTDGSPELEVMTDPLVGEPARYEVPVEQNLVLRALALAGATRRVLLIKRVPVGAGLGGGSADAAAVLAALGGPFDLHEIVRTLGSDVPACMAGGHVMVRGTGEQIELLEDLDLVVTLVIPEFSLATGAVYRAFDEVGPAEGANQLLLAAETVEPRLRALRVALADQLGRPVELAGSGSTLFVRAGFDELGLEPTATDGINRATEGSVAGERIVYIECRSAPRSSPRR